MMAWKDKKALLVFGVGLVAVMAIAESCRAGGCARAVCAPVVHHKAAVVQEVVAQPAYAAPIVNYFYQVGGEIRQQEQNYEIARQVVDLMAAQTKTVRTETVTNYQAVQQPQHYAAPQQQCPTCPPPAPHQGYQPPQFNFTAPPQSQLDQSCAKCHTGESSKGGFNLEAMGPGDTDRAARAITEGRMPKEGPLNPTEQERALFELWKSTLQQ